MRTTPIVGRKAWFGPHRVGWGLGPASIEGWAVTLVFLAISSFLRRRDQSPKWVNLVLGLTFLTLALLKGTSPGGRQAYRAFKASTAGNEVAGET
ncbi:MAG TPA: hypothetical protein VEJ87_14800 [Acidimicrobiales bacterium]|nr:hypothetical protein [Acidimicrobiales bacterium]